MKNGSLASDQDIRSQLEELESQISANPLSIDKVELFLSLQNQLKDDWTENDFALNLQMTMALQELKDPTFKIVNARLTPEYKACLARIKKWLTRSKPYEDREFLEYIFEQSPLPTYVLLDLLVDMTKKRSLEKLKTDLIEHKKK